MEKTNNLYVKKSASRLAAVQTFYEMMMMDTPSKSAIQNYLDFFEGDKIAEHKDIAIDSSFYKKLVTAVQDRYSEINEMIDQSLPPIISPERLDILVRGILQGAICEFLTEQDTDIAVIINEYVNITHAFYSGNEHSLVNGILSTLSKKIRH
jgi:N utilization substance protein B